MRISHTAKTTCLGPGLRYVIWVQGCKKRCRSCINPDGWDIGGGIDVSVEKLVSEIKSERDISGITISGGEPFLQLDELIAFVDSVKKETELDIMIYSGYSLKELIQMYGDRLDALFPNVDIFIDGEYVDELNDNSAYRGSENQKIYCFTERYRDMQEYFESHKGREFSFEIKDGGEVIFIGIPPKDFYSKFIEKIGVSKL